MTLQVLVSAVNKNVDDLVASMNLKSDAIIINQCNHNGYEERDINGKVVQFYEFNERGVGLSRNNALLRASSDIVLFSDDDIVYEDDYEQKVLKAFEEHKNADAIFFNMDVCENRRTYHTEKVTKIGFFNSGRYPTYSLAVRREKLHKAGITFSLLFGGGAKYSAGEDSLFIRDCLRKKLKLVAVPVNIGKEEERESTWFKGYTEKFFFDRGVLYHFLYGSNAKLFAWLFIKRKKSFMCKDIPAKKAYKIMKDGIREGRK